MKLDIPITSSKEDSLSRTSIVNKIISCINNHQSQHSLAIGIEGAWGSGKTSILNLVKENLRECSKESLRGYDKDTLQTDKYIIVDFNPWMHLSADKIIEDFFLSLANAIEKTYLTNTLIDHLPIRWGLLSGNLPKRQILGLRREMIVYAKIISKITNLPLITDITSILENILTDEVKSDSYNIKLSLEKRMFKLDRKVICIIDDIDRLDATETLTIFKLTKIIADLPNVIFLLAYDREKTSTMLSHKLSILEPKSGNLGGEYIQKIIQISLPVPVIDFSIRKKYFNELTKTLHGRSEINDGEIAKLYDVYEACLKSILNTPRKEKIFIIHILSILGDIKLEEFYIRDFLLLEVIRVYAIRVYYNLSDHKEEILGIDPSKSEKSLVMNQLVTANNKKKSNEEHKDGYNALLENLLSGCPEKIRDEIISVITIMYSENVYLSIQKDEDTHIIADPTGRGLINNNNWDKYFALQLHPDRISEEKSEYIISQLERENGDIIFLEEFYKLNLPDQRYIGNKIDKYKISTDYEHTNMDGITIGERAKGNNDTTFLKNTLFAFWDMSIKEYDTENGIYLSDNLKGVVYKILKILDSTKPPKDLDSIVIKLTKWEKSIIPSLFLVDTLLWLQEGPTVTPDDRISDRTVNLFIKNCRKRIENDITDNKIKSRELFAILEFHERCSNSGDAGIATYKRLYGDDYRDYFEKLEKVVNQIDLTKVTDSQKQAVQSFIKDINELNKSEPKLNHDT